MLNEIGLHNKPKVAVHPELVPMGPLEEEEEDGNTKSNYSFRCSINPAKPQNHLNSCLKMQFLPQRKHTAYLTKNTWLMLCTGIV